MGFFGRPGGGGSWGSITGTITSQSDLAAALSAKIGFSSGLPDNGTGSNGDRVERTDGAFNGVRAVKTAGTWANESITPYTLAAGANQLPVASATYLGLTLPVSDLQIVNGATGRTGWMECVTTDGGSTYWWREVSGVWQALVDVVAKTAVTGSTSATDVTGATFTFPNRTDVLPAGTRIEIETLASATGTAGSKTFDVVNTAVSATFHQEVLAAANLGGQHISRIDITGAATGKGFPYSGTSSGYGVGTMSTYSSTWANLGLKWRVTLGNAADSCTIESRRITIVQP